MTFILPGLDHIVQKIVPNFDGTVTVFAIIRGQPVQFVLPHNGDFNATSTAIMAKYNKIK